MGHGFEHVAMMITTFHNIVNQFSLCITVCYTYNQHMRPKRAIEQTLTVLRVGHLCFISSYLMATYYWLRLFGFQPNLPTDCDLQQTENLHWEIIVPSQSEHAKASSNTGYVG